MITKYGKETNFKELNRDLDFIRTAGKKNSKHSLRAFEKGVREIAECPICKSNELSMLKEINRFIWNKCAVCGQVFVSNIPVNTSETFDETCEALNPVYISEKLFYKRREIIAKPKAEFINGAVTKDGCKGGLWVDIGCGVGELLAEAASLGWETLGFDADRNEVSFAREHGINVKQAYIGEGEDIHYDALADADIVSFLNVLMYIEKPQRFLNDIIPQIKSGSYVVIEVPRAPSLSVLCSLIGLPYKNITGTGVLNVFTEESMEILRNQYSLELVAQWNFGNGFIDILQTAMFLSNSEIDETVLEPFWRHGSALNKAVDEAGLSECMMLIYKKI